MHLYIFDQDYCISKYYTVCAEDPSRALIQLKQFLRLKAKKDTKKGADFHEYYKWRDRTIYDLPDNYRIEIYDQLQVIEHERI